MTSTDIKNQNLQKIKDAAEKLFLQNGIESTTVNAIAKLSGISKVSIYNHFESKTHIAIAIASEAIDNLEVFYKERYFGQAYQKKNGLEQVSDILMSFTDVGEYDATYYYFLMDFAAHMHRHMEFSEQSLHLNEKLDNVTKPYFIAAVQKGRAEGMIVQGPEAEELFFLMTSALRGVYQQYFIKEPSFDGQKATILRDRLRMLSEMLVSVLRSDRR